MELKVTKEFSDIVNLLETLGGTIATEIDIMQEEFKQKYSLDITQEILEFATELVRMKISILFKDALHEYDRFTILLDCTEIDLNMNELEAIIRRVVRQMQDQLPPDTGPEKVQIELKKYLRKLICKIPSRWTKPVVQLFLSRFEDTLSQLGVIVS